MFNRPFSLVHFVFHVMILRRFDPLSCSLKRVHASMNILFLMNKTKDQISWVSSHDLYWENKMYTWKRSIGTRKINGGSRFREIKVQKPCVLFSVFMWRNHIPKLNFTFPSQVLVSSDKRPYRNLTYYIVSARQGSSYCNRVTESVWISKLLRCATWKLRSVKAVA